MNADRTWCVTRGVQLPALWGRQLAIYCDREAEGFWPMGPWRDRWNAVRTLGLDAGVVRVRLVAEQVPPRARA
jgi:hypothetical protein